MKNNIFTTEELKKLKVGDTVLLTYKDLETDDGFSLEKSEVIISESAYIAFKNEYGTFDFYYNEYGLCIEDSGESILIIYKPFKTLDDCKQEWAKDYNKTWEEIKEDFEYGLGLSKTYSFEKVMDMVAEIYKKQ